MSVTLLALLSHLALAQSDAGPGTEDVAAPEPSGCWGDPQYAVPDQNAFDVPLDTAPRFYFDGPCEQPVFVTLSTGDGFAVSHALEQRDHDFGTTVVVTPDADLQPDTTYSVRITADTGNESVLRFTTGNADSAPAPDVVVEDHEVTGWCEGRELAYSGRMSLLTDQDGLLGYVTNDVDDPRRYQALLGSNGAASVWFTVQVGDDDVESCVQIATFESDGSLGGWSEACAPLPEVGPCRRRAFGCGAQPVATRGDALVFLPLVGLAWLRRRRKATV